MIILVENENDRKALAKVYDWIIEQSEIHGIDMIDTKSMYEARIINIDKN